MQSSPVSARSLRRFLANFDGELAARHSFRVSFTVDGDEVRMTAGSGLGLRENWRGVRATESSPYGTDPGEVPQAPDLSVFDSPTTKPPRE